MSKAATRAKVESEPTVDLRKRSPEIHGSSPASPTPSSPPPPLDRYLVECTCQAEEDRVRRMTGRLFWDVQFDEDL